MAEARPRSGAKPRYEPPVVVDLTTSQPARGIPYDCESGSAADGCSTGATAQYVCATGSGEVGP